MIKKIYKILLFSLATTEMLGSKMVVTLESKGRKIPQARVVFDLGKEEKEYISQKDGSVMANLPDGKVFVKVFHQGFKPKGYITNLTGRHNVTLELKSIKSTIKGRVMDLGSFLSDQTVTMESLDSKVEYTAVTDSNGEFFFENVPIREKYVVCVKREGYIPYKSKEIFPTNIEGTLKEIHLRKSEEIITIKLIDKKGRVIADDVIEVNGDKFFTDENGLAVAKLRYFHDNKIEISYKGKNITKEIDLEKRYNNIIIEF